MTGIRAWILQRLTAVYMLGYLLFLAGALARYAPDGYPAWRGMLSVPLISSATLLFFTALLVHAWVGIRDVILDYVRPAVMRLALLALLGLWLVGLGIWVARVLLVVWI